MQRNLHLLPVLVGVVATVSLTQAAVDCSGGDGFKCESCSTLALCSGGSVATTFPCQSGQMCEEGSSGPGACLSISDSRTQCQCSSYPSYVVDSYDPQSYLLCISSTMQIPLSCPAGEEFDSDTSQCAALPTTIAVPTTAEPTATCTEDGIFPLLPSCSGYYGCYTVGGSVMSTGIVSCNEPTPVFNPDTLACEASISGPATPTCASDDIITADTVECNAFYICNSGAIVGEKICCGEGQVFNPATIRCEADTGSVTCPTANPCYTGEVVKVCETSTSTSASSTSSSSISSSLSTSSSVSSTSLSTTYKTDTSTSTSTEITESSTSTDSTTETDSTSTTTVSTSETSSISTSTASTSETSSISTSTASTSEPDDISSSTTSTTSTTSATTTAGVPDCTENIGSFPYPGDCTKYYFCYEGELAEQTCSGSLIFSPGVGCTTASNYDCPY